MLFVLLGSLIIAAFHSDKHGFRSEKIQEFINSRSLRGVRFYLKPVRCCSISAFSALQVEVYQPPYWISAFESTEIVNTKLPFSSCQSMPFRHRHRHL